jgi:regulatory protein
MGNTYTAEKYAAYLLARQRYTVQEMRDKLTLKGYEKAEIDRVIKLLLEYEYLNDEKYATSFANDASKFKGKSRRQIIYSLKQKGISQEFIDKATENINDEDKLLRQIEIFFENHDINDYIMIQKIKRRLYGKGFSISDINSAIESIRIRREEPFG